MCKRFLIFVHIKGTYLTNRKKIKMKIVAEHLISRVQGLASARPVRRVIQKVIELENGKFYFEKQTPNGICEYELCTFDLKDPFFDEGL